jgi:hypothetical protein
MAWPGMAWHFRVFLSKTFYPGYFQDAEANLVKAVFFVMRRLPNSLLIRPNTFYRPNTILPP